MECYCAVSVLYYLRGFKEVKSDCKDSIQRYGAATVTPLCACVHVFPYIIFDFLLFPHYFSLRQPYENFQMIDSKYHNNVALNITNLQPEGSSYRKNKPRKVFHFKMQHRNVYLQL